MAVGLLTNISLTVCNNGHVLRDYCLQYYVNTGKLQTGDILPSKSYCVLSLKFIYKPFS